MGLASLVAGRDNGLASAPRSGGISMKSVSRLAVLLCAGALAALAPAALAAPDKALEARFDAMISPAEMDGWLKTMAAEPNHVGSPNNKANAELTLAQFK